MAVVVTVAKGYDLGYAWKNQGQAAAEQTTGGYYINAAQAGEPPGRWWGRDPAKSFIRSEAALASIFRDPGWLA